MDSVCPRCGRESLSGTVCSFCGPVGQGGSFQPQPDLAAGWKGFDRDLGAKKREEREAAFLRGSRSSEGFRIPWGAIGSLLTVAVVAGGVWWLWSTGRLNTGPLAGHIPDLPSIGGLPTQLKKAPSDARPSLTLLGRSLAEFATETEHKFGTGDLENEINRADVDRYRERLNFLKDNTNRLESQLTREERRVLMAFQHAEKMLDNYLTRRGHNEPDMDNGQIHAAQEQIQRALAVARGEKVENVIVVFARKAKESAKAQKDALEVE